MQWNSSIVENMGTSEVSSIKRYRYIRGVKDIAEGWVGDVLQKGSTVCLS